MSDYLYAVIPYNKGVILYSPDELEEGVLYPNIPELKGIDTEYTGDMTLFKGYIQINTCHRLSSFTGLEDGYSSIRADIYKIAKAVGVSEVWYIAELCTDKMYAEGFSFEKWANRLKNDKGIVVEMSVDVLKDKHIYSYYHDDFSDVVLTKPSATTGKDVEYSDVVCDITQVISLLGDGNIKIELKDSHWDDISVVMARSLKEASDKIKGILAGRHVDYPNRVNNKYEDKDDCIQRTMIAQYIKALDLASWEHREQKDKAGKPYFGHIARVSNACKTPPAKIALLHDMIEDTDVTPEQMKELGFSEYIIKAVLCLTRQDDEPYENFIKRAAKNPIAREVKIADLEDNMDVRRLNEVKEEDIERTEKYLKAWKYLRNYNNR